MSRSNPNDHGTQNPAVRWFEWNGDGNKGGMVRYYDRDQKKNIDVPLPFTFMLLDQLGAVRGWHDASKSGIYSNEVKDTRQDAMVVKSFKGGVLAEGIYKDIKDRVNRAGGSFVANCYIAFKHNGDMAIGVLRFKGAALGAWMEFTKANRADLNSKAVTIHAYTEGQKGSIRYRMPTCRVVNVSEASNNVALALDVQLQEFLAGYLRRPKREQVDHPSAVPPEDEFDSDAVEPPHAEPSSATITDEDIPFAWMMPLLLPSLLALGSVLA